MSGWVVSGWWMTSSFRKYMVQWVGSGPVMIDKAVHLIQIILAYVPVDRGQILNKKFQARWTTHLPHWSQLDWTGIGHWSLGHWSRLLSDFSGFKTSDHEWMGSLW